LFGFEPQKIILHLMKNYMAVYEIYWHINLAFEDKQMELGIWNFILIENFQFFSIGGKFLFKQ
jgi:hypothetical protein